jgi:hypothetical protein
VSSPLFSSLFFSLSLLSSSPNLGTNAQTAFDHPLSTHAWHFYLEHHVNTKLPFARFHLTTYVICAADAAEAEERVAQLLDEVVERGWGISVPRAGDWKGEVEELGLVDGGFFEGVRPG